MISVLVVERSLSLNSLLSSSLSSLLLSVELELLGPICPQLEQVCLREGLNRFASVNYFLDYIRTLRGEGRANQMKPSLSPGGWRLVRTLSYSLASRTWLLV